MDKMRLVFIGSGSAFTTGGSNYHSNMLLINDNNKAKKLLIDCGSDARHALFDLGYSHRDISDVYISHLHADHAGGLEWLALTTKFDPTCSSPDLFAHHDIIEKGWSNTLSGGLNTLQGEVTQLNSFFKINALDDNATFLWEGVEFHIIQTVHVLAGYSLMPSYGLLFDINQKKIFITTDTQFSPAQLDEFYDTADIIFQDCETKEPKSGIHAHFDQLCTLPQKIKSKMWLYHYNPGTLPDALGNGFCGFVQRGQSFTF